MQTSEPRLQVGYHTGVFNTAYFSFPRAVEWGATRGFRSLECGFVDGVTWNHGLGYFPHVASWEDPRTVRGYLASNAMELSQLDAAFPLSGREGQTVGVPYVLNAIRWAAHAGCPMVDTTDGLHRPEGLTDDAVFEQMKRCYDAIIPVAEGYDIVVTIESHGYFTSSIERMRRILEFCDSDSLGLTFDTGNVFIAGEDPVAYLEAFVDRVAHVHIKDVAPQLAESARGKQAGIGMSHTAIGDGVNAGNIVRCVDILKAHGYTGAVSLECDAAGGPVLDRSADWFRSVLDSAGYVHDMPSPVSGDSSGIGSREGRP